LHVRRSFSVLGTVAVAGIALAGCITPGVHQVTPKLMNGTVSPGLWHTFGGINCYWERLSGTSGAPSDVIANFSSPSGPRYVEIEEADAAFNSRECLPWVQADGPFDKRFGQATDGTFPDGDYRVGNDVEAGDYKASISGSCHWARVSAFTGESDAIIEQGTTATVTIDGTDFGFQSTGCGVWSKAT
jgi:hypothetical protein